MKKLLIVVALLLFFSTNQANAFTSVRCNNGKSIVSVGDTRDEVLDKCGSPTSTYSKGSTYHTKSRGTIRKVKNRPYYRVDTSGTIDETFVECWRYKNRGKYGAKANMVTLEIKGDVVTSVSR